MTPTQRAAPRGRPSTDVGELALEEIYKLLRIDEAWSWRRPRGFSWIAHRLIQSTDASPVFESRGIKISRMVSRVTVVEDVRLPQTAAEKLVGAFNHLAVGSAYVYLSEDRRVDAIMAHIVHDETLKMRSKQIAAYQMLALAFAELHSERLADAFQGKVATRQHPAAGKRLQADDMLNVVATFYLSSRGGSALLFCRWRGDRASSPTCAQDAFLYCRRIRRRDYDRGGVRQ